MELRAVLEYRSWLSIVLRRRLRRTRILAMLSMAYYDGSNVLAADQGDSEPCWCFHEGPHLVSAAYTLPKSAAQPSRDDTTVCGQLLLEGRML